MEKLNTPESWMSKYPEPLEWERFEKMLADTDFYIRETRKSMLELCDDPDCASVFAVVLRNKKLCEDSVNNMSDEELYRFSRWMERVKRYHFDDFKELARVEARKILFRNQP